MKPFTKFGGQPVGKEAPAILPKRRSGVAVSAAGLNDDFTGSAGSISGRTPTVGGQWELRNGVVSLNGSGSVVATAADSIAVAESSKADGVITLTMTVHATNAGGIVFRFLDVQNYWRVQIAATSIKIMEVTGGVTNQRATATGFQSTGTLILTLTGNSISCAGTLVNGAPATFNSSVGATRTKYGVYFGAAGPTMSSILMP